MNFSRFISRVSAARKESPIRETTRIKLQNPEVISLAGGYPNPAMFPFQSAEIKTRDGLKVQFNEEDMKTALQYSASQGAPDLLKWVKKLHVKYHNPPIMKNEENEGFAACVSCGSQDGLIKVFEMLVNPGDNVLLDDPCYSGTLAMVKPMDCNLIPVTTDHHGLQPNSLLSVLEKWKPESSHDPKSDIPRVLYTIPNCGNPTGATQTLERKKEIYAIAQKYDLVIVEDDPYFFLQFNTPSPSYQAIDVDGRVIRCDSMSKVMSSGLRIGWISGAYPFIQRLILHQQASILHTSTFVQMTISRLLDQWGLEGFENHTKNVQKFYKERRDAMIKYATKWLTGLAEWAEPEGGMFLWIKLIGVDDTTLLIKKKALEKKVLLLPGSAFGVVEGTSSSFCRVSYSFATDEEMDEACRRLAELLQEERG
uniref:kynurenine/alpha-aminoadipate aminotransferase, mitochondrial-like n=1 Tax=Ciona intestinalis TaxID=7719 RepID=UPI000180C911|nr:kynurenine/alpha-aminoadipate aminotransferase, mitochondrial-like [Ciona intestinalis]|eukprot:XP_002125496.1 kynurenine/alpha-aminoadipate aminotransferase, mitochondrial-like [Ciona intestinalis]